MRKVERKCKKIKELIPEIKYQKKKRSLRNRTKNIEGGN